MYWKRFTSFWVGCLNVPSGRKVETPKVETPKVETPKVSLTLGASEPRIEVKVH